MDVETDFLKDMSYQTDLVAPLQIIIKEEYRPSDDEPYMNPKQLEYFQTRLLAWRAQLLEEFEEALAELKEGFQGEFDFLDQSAWETSTSLKLQTRERYLKLLKKIDYALEKIKNGTYGYCETTGEEIGLRRLEAHPIATLSRKAQEWHERNERTKRNSCMYYLKKRRY
jgi:DnaK suppressor protein